MNRVTLALLAVLPLFFAGCFADPAQPELVWGKHGVQEATWGGRAPLPSTPKTVSISSISRPAFRSTTAMANIWAKRGVRRTTATAGPAALASTAIII